MPSQFLNDWDKCRKTKNKKLVLNKMLEDKGLKCRVEYRKIKYKPGWYICEGPMEGQRIGWNFFDAKSFIEGRTLDFLMEDSA